MKYLVMEILLYPNGAVQTPTNAYDSREGAEAKYHSILAKAAVSKLACHSAVMLDEQGLYIKSESFRHEVEPEPEPTTE